MDYTQYQEVKAGEKADTKVTEVNEGKQSDFRTDKYFEMWFSIYITQKNIEGSAEEIEKIKKSAAIQIRTENSAELVVNLPNNNKISPKSKLAMYKKTYGDFPKVGQKVSTKTDDNGFFRIVLEASWFKQTP